MTYPAPSSAGEFRHLVQERTQAGMEAARACGITFGRPVPANQDEEARKVVELTEKGLTRKEVAKVLGLSEPTVYRRQQHAPGSSAKDDRQRVYRCQGEGYRAYLRRESPRANPYPYSAKDDCLAWIRDTTKRAQIG